MGGRQPTAAGAGGTCARDDGRRTRARIPVRCADPAAAACGRARAGSVARPQLPARATAGPRWRGQGGPGRRRTGPVLSQYAECVNGGRLGRRRRVCPASARGHASRRANGVCRPAVWGRNSDLEEVHDSALEYDAFEQVGGSTPRTGRACRCAAWRLFNTSGAILPPAPRLPWP